MDLQQILQLTLDGRKVVRLAVDGREVWSEAGPVQSGGPLTFIARGDTMAVAMTENLPGDFEYSADGGSTWAAVVKGQAVEVSGAGSTVKFRALSSNPWTELGWDRKWNLTGDADLSGDVTTLWDKAGGLSSVEAKMTTLFQDMQVVDASKLEFPAVVLCEGAYNWMFYACFSLTAGPAVLPAETLPEYAYSNMFNFTQLRETPVISARSAGWGAIEGVGGSGQLSAATLCLTSWGGGNNWYQAERAAVQGKLFCLSALGTDETITRGEDGYYCPKNWLVATLDEPNPGALSTAVKRGTLGVVLYDGQAHSPSAEGLSAWNRVTLDEISGLQIQTGGSWTAPGTYSATLTAPGYEGELTAQMTIVDNDIAACQVTLGRVFDGDPGSWRVYSPELGRDLRRTYEYTMQTTAQGGGWNVTFTGTGNWRGSQTLYRDNTPEGDGVVTVYPLTQGGGLASYAAAKLKKSDPLAPDVKLQYRYVSDQTGAWHRVPYDTLMADPEGVQLRAADWNAAFGDSNYRHSYLLVGSDGSQYGSRSGVSGDVRALLDRACEISSLSNELALWQLFADYSDQLYDASGLSARVMVDAGEQGHALQQLFQQTPLTAAPDFAGVSVDISKGYYNFGENFYGCNGLSAADVVLPWIVRSGQGHGDTAGQQNFWNCHSLVSAAVRSHFGDGRPCDDALSGEELWLAQSMFNGCENLSCISTDLTAWPHDGFPSWLQRAPAEGLFICPAALDATIRDSSHIPTGWTVQTY